MLVRAIGPSLPVDGKLADPMLELRDNNGALIRARLTTGGAIRKMRSSRQQFRRPMTLSLRSSKRYRPELPTPRSCEV